ncbi:MAG: dienelactone hydrolase family protein [Flavitalea sp.]
MSSSFGQDTSLFKRMTYVNGKNTLNYRILYPTKYDVNKKYPVLLFLHGSGERGGDNEKQLAHVAQLFLDSANRVKFPAFVIVPQCPEGDFWVRIMRDNTVKDSLGQYRFLSGQPMGKALMLVQQLMDSLVKTAQVNTHKVYIGGLSMGGMGTFELLWRKPKFYAAAFPICGGGDPLKVTLYAKNFPIWVFHGGADPVVPVANSHLMVNALKDAGSKVIYTEYPGVGHNSWNNALAEPTLLSWLFDQKR